MHIVKARVNQLIIKACHKKLSEIGKGSGDQEEGMYAICLLETLRDLEKIQRLYLPKTHISFGATLGESHAALTFCLERHKHHLFSQCKDLGNFSKASREELRLRRESERVQALYRSSNKRVTDSEQKIAAETEQKGIVRKNDKAKSASRSQENALDDPVKGSKAASNDVKDFMTADVKLDGQDEAWDLFD